MASRVLTALFLFSLLITASHPHQLASQESFISINISQTGLDFIKDILVKKAVASIIPLKLPTIEKSKKIPVVGDVHMVLSNVTIEKVNVLKSTVKPGDTGVVIVASGINCYLSMKWKYSYSTWLIEVSDHGSASVEVQGMEVGLTLGLKSQEGSLKLLLMDCGCYVQDIDIKLDGGASWLYQGMVDAFEGKISSAVEDAVTKKMKEGISKLDSLLRNLPHEVPVDDIASLNVTFVGEPALSANSIGFQINGLFTQREKVQIPMLREQNLQVLDICGDTLKMLGISLDEAVFNSASALYYNAKYMQWIVDKVPDQSLLNTAEWRFIVPQLYRKYPNDDMNLNISLTSPPVIRITKNNIDTTVYADLVVDVLEANEVIPVACISLVVRGSGLVKVSKNNLAGSVKLNDFDMSLKWSKVGNLRLYLIQPVMWTLIQTVFLPYVNLHLGRGFPLPIIHGFTLVNAQIICRSSTIAVCSDVTLAESQYFRYPMIQSQ